MPVRQYPPTKPIVYDGVACEEMVFPEDGTRHIDYHENGIGFRIHYSRNSTRMLSVAFDRHREPKTFAALYSAYLRACHRHGFKAQGEAKTREFYNQCTPGEAQFWDGGSLR